VQAVAFTHLGLLKFVLTSGDDKVDERCDDNDSGYHHTDDKTFA
jgi:hypothetical protein